MKGEYVDSVKGNICVIGAGIVGVSTAIWLQRDGYQVTLVDREGPAAGASFGNAGVLAAGAIVPVTTPGLLKKAPGMLFDPNQPLFLRWSYLPKLLPFLWRYLKHANAKSVDQISQGLATLLHDCPDQHIALAKGTLAEKYVGSEDYLFGYKDEATFKADSYGWGVRASRGVNYKPLNKEDMAELDPALAGRFGYGVQCYNHGRISDPGEYVKALAQDFINKGGKLVKATVDNFDIKNGRCDGVNSDIGMIKADKYILTTGAWSSAWEKELGISVPMEAERGYHIEFVNPSITLRAPTMVASGKFVIHSMDGRLRCAGIVEFGGLTTKRSKAPIKLLKKQMAELFPDLKYDRIDEWMGYRPSTSDSLPIIGVSPNAENVVLGYGHQHIGLSAGPKTGRWLAGLVANTQINTDLSVFAPDR